MKSCSLAALVYLVILVSFATTNLLVERLASNEAAAIGDLKTIGTAQLLLRDRNIAVATDLAAAADAAAANADAVCATGALEECDAAIAVAAAATTAAGNALLVSLNYASSIPELATQCSSAFSDLSCGQQLASPNVFDGDGDVYGYQFQVQGVVAGAVDPAGGLASSPGFKVIATPKSVATGNRAFAHWNGGLITAAVGSIPDAFSQVIEPAAAISPCNDPAGGQGAGFCDAPPQPPVVTPTQAEIDEFFHAIREQAALTAIAILAAAFNDEPSPDASRADAVMLAGNLPGEEIAMFEGALGATGGPTQIQDVLNADLVGIVEQFHQIPPGAPLHLVVALEVVNSLLAAYKTDLSNLVEPGLANGVVTSIPPGGLFSGDIDSLLISLLPIAVPAFGAAGLVLLVTGLLVAYAAAGRRGAKHLNRGGD